jgi:hypothetical protein
MHTLKEKKGKRTIMHHFHHIKQRDGKSRPVYLGADPEKSRDKLTKIKIANIRSSNKLIREAETAQAKLQKLGHYNKPYDDIISDMRRSYQKKKEVTALLDNANRTPTPFPFSSYGIMGSALILCLGAFYLLFSNPTITGAAVTGATKIAANQFIVGAFGMLIVILILGVTLHSAEHRHKHRHDKYKPPSMLE